MVRTCIFHFKKNANIYKNDLPALPKVSETKIFQNRSRFMNEISFQCPLEVESERGIYDMIFPVCSLKNTHAKKRKNESNKRLFHQPKGSDKVCVKSFFSKFF